MKFMENNGCAFVMTLNVYKLKKGLRPLSNLGLYFQIRTFHLQKLKDQGFLDSIIYMLSESMYLRNETQKI